MFLLCIWTIKTRNMCECVEFFVVVFYRFTEIQIFSNENERKNRTNQDVWRSHIRKWNYFSPPLTCLRFFFSLQNSFHIAFAGPKIADWLNLLCQSILRCVVALTAISKCFDWRPHSSSKLYTRMNRKWKPYKRERLRDREQNAKKKRNCSKSKKEEKKKKDQHIVVVYSVK